MKFDVVIGNPPYQEIKGGGSVVEFSIPIYNKFIELGIQLGAEYMAFIIPSRWLSGIQRLDKFRSKMLESGHIKKMVCYRNSAEVFKEVDISGGVQYFLYDTNYNDDKTEMINVYKGDTSRIKRSLLDYTYTDTGGNVQYMSVIDNKSCSIIDKVLSTKSDNISKWILSGGPFGLGTEFKGEEFSKENNIKVVCSNGRVAYTSITNIKNSNILGKYKVIAASLNPDRGGYSRGIKHSVLGSMSILNPMEICTQTYIVAGSFDSEDMAVNYQEYLQTKFARYLILQTITNIHLVSKNFIFVPELDFSKQWTDKVLYEKYSLTTDEIREIDKVIR